MTLRLAVCLLLISAISHSAELVRVDLSDDRGPATQRASGFLHAMSATVPKARLVDPLKPRLFRMRAEDWQKNGCGGFASYQRITKLGARLQIVVSDSHGYSLAGWWPGDKDDWKAWEGIPERLVRQAREKRYAVEWDIWNEPDIKYFWALDRDRFLETWKNGYQAIRRIDPKAVIVGPSLARFDREYLTAFLKYAKQNDVLPDILSWHEMSKHKDIPAHVDEMRRFVRENGIPISRFCINEMIGPQQQTNPGVTVRYLAGIERAQADGACHACWSDKDPGVSNCENQTLDGILTHGTRLPRSTWWAYKGYADVTGRLLGVTPSETVDGIAGVEVRKRTVRLVLGRDGGEKGDVTVRLEKLRLTKVHVLARRIPDSGWKTLAQPAETLNADYTTNEGILDIVLPDFGPSDAYTVVLEPAGI